ncbi:MAG: hypothetical protein K9G41_03500 [Flavobacteriales bacterium]|nr:hypothetical protein [Flavobacteriales bacterium]
MDYIGIWDFILVPLFLVIAHYMASRTAAREISKYPEYKYYKSGLLFKIYGGVIFGLVYAFYYNGGDTMVYWEDAKILNTVIFHEPLCYLKILLGDTRATWFYCFDLSEHVPHHYLRDQQAYSVSRLTAPMALLSVDSFFGCTILVAWLCFGGVWRLYRVFIEEYPDLQKELAIAFLFIPSVAFWGSGVMKDAYTFTAACWMTSSVYGLLLKRREIAFNLVAVLFSSYIMITMKPYIFVALMPGTLLWVVFNRIQKIESGFLRVLSAPIIIMIGFVAGSIIFSQTSGRMESYGSVDSVVEKAIATQEDLKREAYEGNSFDIGTIDPSMSGMARKAPLAIFAGLFRPTLLDVRNPVMLISAIENTVLMLFLFYMFFKVGVFSFFKYIFSRPMIMFSFVFAVFFAFAVGLTTSNFGSLVRYKIPSLPFLLASLYMIRYHRVQDKDAPLGRKDDGKTAQFQKIQ